MVAQVGDEGGDLPVPLRDRAAQALAARGPAMGPSHGGRGFGFIDEDQSIRIKIDLVLKADPALAQDVGTVLFGGRGGLFTRDAVAVEEKKRQSVLSATERPRSWPAWLGSRPTSERTGAPPARAGSRHGLHLGLNTDPQPAAGAPPSPAREQAYTSERRSPQ